LIIHLIQKNYAQKLMAVKDTIQQIVPATELYGSVAILKRNYKIINYILTN